MTPAMIGCIVVFGLAVLQSVPHRQSSRCAAPRSNEPLLLDAKQLPAVGGESPAVLVRWRLL